MRIVFIAMLLAATSLCLAQDKPMQTASSDEAVTSTAVEKARKIIVYYFHGGARCTNCINFERYTTELMNTVFAPAQRDGALEWKIVNTDERENAHFMKDFGLYTKSLVVVESVDGKPKSYKNLQGIWTTIGSKQRFQDYVKMEVSAVLGPK
jgi:hypothetical protein